MVAIDDIKSLLSENWTASNADDETPVIDLVLNYKRVDLSIKSAILIYQDDRNEQEIGLGAGQKTAKEYITIDIRTAKSRDHLINLYKEVERIIDKNVKTTPNWDFIHIQHVKDLSDKMRKLWRYIVDVEMWKIIQER